MKQTNTKLLGMFVVGGIALFAVGIVVFGSGRFFQQMLARVAYFQEPLAGLADGAIAEVRKTFVGAQGTLRRG